MNLDQLGKLALFIDLIAVGGLLVVGWLDLRRQTSDIGRVGGVVTLAALGFVFYFVGRALLGI